MPNVVVVGAQWGDEGKGKIIDILAPQADYIVRYQGGNNAGHTVVLRDTSFILHLIPKPNLAAPVLLHNLVGFGCQRVCKDVHIPVAHSATQPNVEKVSYISIRDGVIIGWISDD